MIDDFTTQEKIINFLTKGSSGVWRKLVVADTLVNELGINRKSLLKILLSMKNKKMIYYKRLDENRFILQALLK